MTSITVLITSLNTQHRYFQKILHHKIFNIFLYSLYRCFFIALMLQKELALGCACTRDLSLQTLACKDRLLVTRLNLNLI